MEAIKVKLKEILKNKVIIACLLLTTIYMFSGYWKWIEIAMPIVATVFFVIMSPQQSMCIFVFLHSFTLSNIGYDSCFLGTIACFTIVLTIKYILGARQGKYSVYKDILIAISVFMLVSTIISLPSRLYGGAFIYFTYLPLAYMIFAMRKDFDIHQIMNYMLFGFVLSCSLSILTFKLPYFKYNPFWDNERFQGFINQPNYTYMRALFLLTYYMYRYLHGKLTHIKFAIVYIVLAILTIATLSKFGIGLLVLMTGIFTVLYLKKDFKTGIKVVGVLFVLACLVSLVSYKLLIQIFDRFMENNGNIINSLLTGRDDIWRDYLNACCKNPFTLLFGNGLLTQEVYIHAQGMTRASHNLYLFLLYRFGIIGCMALIYILYLFVKHLGKGKPKLIAYLPLIWLLIESLCDNTFKCYNITYFIFASMILFADTELKTKQEENSPTDKSILDKEKEHAI